MLFPVFFGKQQLITYYLMKDTFMAGFTTVRNVGSVNYIDSAVIIIHSPNIQLIAFLLMFDS